MKLYIRNMVCNRCIMVVRNEIEKAGFHPEQVELGEVTIQEDPDKAQLENLDKHLRQFGFELIDDRKSRTIEKIKTIIVELVHHSEEDIHTNLSDYISSK